MKWVAYIVSFCLCSAVALGGIITTEPASGWAETDWLADGAEYQWGATARNPKSSPDTWELGIGNNADMTEGTPESQANLDWGAAGTPHAFVLDYDAVTHQVIWTMDSRSVSLDVNAPFSDMYIQLKAYQEETSVTVTNVSFNMGLEDIGIDSFSAIGADPEGMRQYMHLNTSEGLLSDMDFVLEGTLMFDWSGAVPTGEEDLGLHIKFTQIPEPASIAMVILTSMAGLFIRRRFR